MWSKLWQSGNLLFPEKTFRWLKKSFKFMKRKLTGVFALYKRAFDSCVVVVTSVVESGKEELLSGCGIAVYCAGNSECIG